MSKDLVTKAQFSPAQIDLIKATVAKGATDDELKLFLYRCERMGLDALSPGQVHFVKYGTAPGTMIIGLDGFRLRALRSGKHIGTKRGLIMGSAGQLVGAWAEVYREGWQTPAREEVLLTEFNTGKAMWAKMPGVMIQKVAEVAALRMAFPDQLAGLYSSEEMGQAEARDVTVDSPKLAKLAVEDALPDDDSDQWQFFTQAIDKMLTESDLSDEIKGKVVGACASANDWRELKRIADKLRVMIAGDSKGNK